MTWTGWAAKVFSWAVIAGGGGVLALHVPALINVRQWDEFLVLVLLLVVMETRSVKLGPEQVSFSGGVAVIYCTLLLLGTSAATIMSAFGSLVHGLVGKKEAAKIAFNTGMLAITTHLTGLSLTSRGVSLGAFDLSAHWFPAALAILLFLGINTGLVAIYLGIHNRKNPLRIWQGAFLTSSIDYIGLGFLGLSGAALTMHEGMMGLITAAALLLFLQNTFNHHVNLGREIAIRTYWEKQAYTDSLTKLANHRQLNQWLQQSLPPDQIVSLIMIDIDDFKQYNDGHGHLMGDEVLRQVAEVLRTHTRKEDLVVRYGGDEFIIILNGIDKQGACNIAERIRTKVTELSTAGFRVTLSLGIATYPEDGSSTQDLLRKADRALYLAKEAGKNLVRTYRAQAV